MDSIDGCASTLQTISEFLIVFRLICEYDCSISKIQTAPTGFHEEKRSVKEDLRGQSDRVFDLTENPGGEREAEYESEKDYCIIYSSSIDSGKSYRLRFK